MLPLLRVDEVSLGGDDLTTAEVGLVVLLIVVDGIEGKGYPVGRAEPRLSAQFVEDLIGCARALGIKEELLLPEGMIALEQEGKAPLLLPQLDEVTGRLDCILRAVLLVTLLELHLGLSWGSCRPSLCS